jgi:DivIVA domain-containing protein
MSEGEFRLTPVDIRAQEFSRAAWGYSAADVEDFRDRVAEEMERLARERVALEERLHNFREQLKSLREREKAINDAVMMAQELREDTKQSASQEAELIIREAHAKAESIVQESRSTEASLRQDIEEAQQQFTTYLTSFRRLLDRQLAQLDALEAHERDGSPPEAV